MAGERSTVPLLRTKLHRPPVAEDHVHRRQLLNRLAERRLRPLTLVSAAAGYGKSTLVSSWVDKCNHPYAWLSLNETDNDLRVFLAYLIAAVQNVFPEACRETREFLAAVDLPPVGVLAHNLINEMEQIDEKFLLVLDDYHVVRDRTIQDLIGKIFDNPPRNMHVILVTRKDPPLPLASLRARDQLTEIRSKDLSFSPKETIVFFRHIFGTELDESSISVIQEKTEGWAVGLRLTALWLCQEKDPVIGLGQLKSHNRYFVDYLVAEILSKLSPAVQQHLLATAMLDRFCTSLCDAMCNTVKDMGSCAINGQEFLSIADRSNLFLVPLDDQGVWFRYHHLFQDLLKRRLEALCNESQISAMHRKASGWFAENGLLEEAAQHSIAANDLENTVQLVAQYRHDLMNQEHWHRLSRLLELFPQNIVEKSPELLLAKAWTAENRFRFSEMFAILDRLNNLWNSTPMNAASAHGLRGEMDALNAARSYFEADGNRALSLAQRALERIPSEQISTRGFAMVVLALSHQINGKAGAAELMVHKALAEGGSYGNTYRGRMLAALCFTHWMEANLSDLGRTATQYLADARKLRLPESESFAHYFSGIRFYHLDHKKEAEMHLTNALALGYKANVNTFAHSTFALALTYQASGRADRAIEIVDSAVERALESHNIDLMITVKSFKAELALRQGHLWEASHWAQDFDPDPLMPAYRFYVPHITLAKVLLAQEIYESFHKAADLLSRLHDFYVSTHNMRFLIEVLALQAVLCHSQGDKTAALKALEHAVKLALPGGFIRLFVDLGPHVEYLLKRLVEHNVVTSYVGRLLSAFRQEELIMKHDGSDSPATPPEGLIRSPMTELLSNREIDILTFLAQRLRNKEIAEVLSISPETVKKHTIRIYRKLGVHSRREAVDRADALGMLSSH
jgi:ATP/maltotriose-dependent transcriptional regulator MalT